MASMVIWIIGIGASVAALVIMAALKQYYIHMAVAAIVSLLIALSAFQETRAQQAAAPPAKPEVLASLNLRHMGMIWTWAALAMFCTYAFGVLTWKEWLHFFIALVVLAGLSLFLSASLKRDAEAGTPDDTLLKVARGYAVFMLVAMIITMIGLAVDGKLWRFATEAGQRPNWQDWGANNIFFFGALGLAAVSWNAISVLRGGTR